MDKALPNSVNVLRLAEHGSVIEGELPISKMKRLKSLLLNDTGNVLINLEFGTGDENRPYVKGLIECELALECQRCLETMKYRVHDEVALTPVLSVNQTDGIPEGFEPLLVTRDAQSLSEIVEDELLLRLPVVAKHENECLSLKRVEVEMTKKSHPFEKVLSELKKNH
jgi:uncharacterized protein